MSEDVSRIPAFDQAWERTIEQDHHAIKELLERLEAVTDPHRLVPLLEELRTSLVEHFEREEAPEGLHEIIADLSPNTVGTLQNILGEHQEFLVQLDRLLAQTTACIEGPVAEVMRDAAALSQRLHEHEARETKLFTDAVFTDLGRSS